MPALVPQRNVPPAARPYALIFDGDCGLCRRYAAWMGQRDHRRLIQAQPYQSAQLEGRQSARARRTILLIHPDGSWQERSRAFFQGLVLTGWGFSHWVMRPPFVDLGDLVYCWVARHRRRVSQFLLSRGW
ncbi:MAG: DCC1-like thiol-disulfide oxidoreductase family protein [Candidatus Neomarinimicrobiota bacterium]